MSLLRFTSIQSIEQRREYKSIFDKDYAEYRKLHEEIDNVSKRFAQLEEKLRMEERSRKESSKVKVSGEGLGGGFNGRNSNMVVLYRKSKG